MPKMKPDRDDRRGSMAGQGGPQVGDIGEGTGDRPQRQSSEELEPTGGDLGEGGQRHRDGSSRDPAGQGGPGGARS